MLKMSQTKLICPQERYADNASPSPLLMSKVTEVLKFTENLRKNSKNKQNVQKLIQKMFWIFFFIQKECS